ncbi:polysaccharide biosynthesis protein [Desulfovibrio oxyclinae]|uniref:polysaccharide biosynthesis protein n=1 Tax=Desulfovibrio oxyclinae TaxID=63560 RepID=UPI00036AE44C|nr:nucleoside-diphosphate sugar epimerase/dehydratase [Desulfovibrio oxyclinae]
MRRLANFGNMNFWLMLAGDMVVFTLSVLLAFSLRFDFDIPPQYAERMFQMIAFGVPLKSLLFLFFGMYRGMWRYTSLDDFWRLIRVTVLQSGLVIAAAAFGQNFEGYPRSVFLLDWGLTMAMASSLRLGIRAMYARGESLRLPKATPRRLLLIGAGDSGERILRDIQSDPSVGVVIGFLDDDRSKLSRTIHGVSVLGTVDDLPEMVRSHDPDEIFITVSNNLSAERMRRLVDMCKATGLPHKVLPPMSEIVDGKVSLGSLREVNYRDLLGRTEVRLETGRIRGYIEDRVVLVTGCGGSIGSELCRQIVRFGPAHMVLVDASEYNLHSIEMELRHEFRFTRYSTVLGNIADRSLMDAVFGTHRPSVVFHAAAYKHVPMLERCPWQAVHNNVVGSRCAMEAAVEHGVDRFVVVSTDKAVRPTNVMGATKRVTEHLMRHYQGRDTKFMAVRFGNVLGSSGSVVPLFRKQIEQGGPVTVTHPDVTRYFMSIAEAAQLILQAGSMVENGRGGEIFVLEMGNPVRIADMARDLIRLYGMEPEKDVRIEYTGLREGEKLYEELITEGEDVVRTEHEKIMVLDTDRHIAPDALLDHLSCLADAARDHDAQAIRSVLRKIVPEYRPLF